MTPTEAHIEEIAELLDCGECCYFHIPSGTIEHFPDPDYSMEELERWQEIIDKVNADRDNYLYFEKMDSNQAFRVMEGFAITLTDEHFRNRLLNLLSQKKPFSKFKYAIDTSNYRQMWFDFKKEAYINWVRAQLTS